MSPVVVWCPSLAAKKANPHQSAMSKTVGPNLGDPTSDGRQETVDSSAACPQTRGSRCQICTIVWSLATQLSLHAKQGYPIKGRTSGNEFVQGSPSPWLSKLSANRFLLLTGSEKCWRFVCVCVCVWNIWRDVKLLPWLTELLFLIRLFAITMNQFWVFYQAFIQSPFQLQGAWRLIS